ncbi:hypothetical protein MKW92_038836 [Papaver armeniacum]|nr:hypothetical protein MKW92_038836 [Papaver armeniacum]
MKVPNKIEPCSQMQPPIGGAPSQFEPEMMPLAMRPPLPPPPTDQMQTPIGAHCHFERGTMPLTMRPPPQPPDKVDNQSLVTPYEFFLSLFNILVQLAHVQFNLPGEISLG